jgi:predicted TIM-barrel fold metal-dependent hydrolase
MIIDFHTHLGRGDDPPAGPLQHDLFPEQILRQMDEAGVDRTVVFPVTYRDYRAANREIAGYVAAHPARLIGFGRVRDTDDGPEIVDEAVNALGLRGFKIHHGCDGIHPESLSLWRVLGRIEKLGVPVIFDAFGANAAKAIPVADRLSSPVVLGHMGGLWNVEAIDRCIACAERNANAYLETSSVLLYEKIEEAIERIGSERILFGTDGPPIHPTPEIAKIRILRIPEEARANILGLNAARLLGISA